MATYCGVLKRYIAVASCPLVEGACMWKHRVTGLCVYTSEDLSVEEFCKRVGLETPPSSEVADLKAAILKAIKE